jgi:CubicO group peptidase (beta-lactamase class C family)
MTPALPALLAALVLATSPQQPDTTRRPPPRDLAELQARIREVLDSTKTPGVSLALVSRDSILWAGGIGKADVASGRDATGQTLFRIGSTSKAVVSLVVLMLQEEGRLRLEDPVRKHAPEIVFTNSWESTDPVRIVNTLTHTTGFDDWSFRDYANSDPTPLTLRQGLDFNPSTRVSRWRPGTRVAYNNTGPPLAAYIAEKLEGKPFEQIAQERVFDPIGMRTATYLYPDTSVAPMATLYRTDGHTPIPYWHVVMRPAGSINASAEDMGAYVRFLLNRGAVDGRQLLPPSAIEQLERSDHWLGAKGGLTVGYGLHIARYVDSGFVWTGHDGGVDGGLTNMAYLPEHGVGFSFSINAGSGTAFQKISRLVRDYLTRDIPRPTPPPVAAMPDETGERYAGWYRPDNPRVQIMHFWTRLLGLTHVAADDSGMVLDPVLGKPSRYLPVTATTLREPTEPVATLALVDDSPDDRPIAMEQMGYLLPNSLVRVATPVAWLEIALTAAWIVGIVLTVLVMLVAVGRFLFRRRRPASPTRTLWRVAIATTLALLLAVGGLAMAVQGGVVETGRPTIYSVGSFVLLLLFGALALVGVLLSLRRRPAGEGRFSPWAARVVLALNLVAAAYLAYWGLIGWRMWA